MKALFFIIMSIIFTTCKAQHNIGKTKSQLLKEKQDCIILFSNAYCLADICHGNYEVFNFEGSLTNTKNNICYEESYEVDSTYFYNIKTSLKNKYPSVKISYCSSEALFDKNDKLYSDKWIISEYMETPDITIVAMPSNAHGEKTKGILTLSIYKTINN